VKCYTENIDVSVAAYAKHRDMTITIPVEYSYILLGVGLSFVWLAAYVCNKTLKKQQLVISVAGSLVCGLSELFFIPDYWQPPMFLSISLFNSYISAADVLFGFSLAGIVCVLPGLIAKEYFKPHDINWRALFSIIAIWCSVLIIAFAVRSLGMNSIYSISLTMIVGASFLVIRSHDPNVLYVSLLGGIALTALMFIVYAVGFTFVSNIDAILRSIWSLYGTPYGLLIAGVPFSELLFAFAVGSLYPILFYKFRV
jgi:hypothetical protein